MTSLSYLDIIVFVSYMGVLFGIGVYCSRQQSNLKTYLLADQNVHWLVVSISVLAALFSGITYLGAPAEAFFHNLNYLWVVVSFLIATPITTVIFLPFFRQANLYTAYEYLERRFDRRLRWLASSLFILRVTFYLGVAIYAPALVVMEVTGWPLWISALLTGLAATIYTTMGGMKAVIWTDTLQFLVLCGGIALIFCFAVAQVPGGLAGAWSMAAADGKTRFFSFSLDPTVRVTMWSGLLGGAAANLVQMVTDQIAVQRYITAKSLADCRRALWFKFWITVPLVSTFYLTGTVLYGYYRVLPERSPAFVNAELVPKLAGATGMPIKNDQLLPCFVVNELPAPLPGLLIAAIFGATMAVVSAGVNALATAAMMDFQFGPSPMAPVPRREGSVPISLPRSEANSLGYLPNAEGILGSLDNDDESELACGLDAVEELPQAHSDRRQLNWARVLTASFGIAPTLLALFVIPYFGTLVESIVKIFGLFGGPLLGIFFLGVLSRRANGSGALVGAVCGGVAGILVLFSEQIWNCPISFLWIALVSATVTWATGRLASMFFAAPSPTVVRELVHPWLH